MISCLYRLKTVSINSQLKEHDIDVGVGKDLTQKKNLFFTFCNHICLNTPLINFVYHLFHEE